MSPSNEAVVATPPDAQLGRATDMQRLQKLRPLGKLEQISAACHHLGFFNNVGLSAHYKLSRPSPAVSDLRHLIYAAAGDVLRQHRILFAIPANEDAPESTFVSLPSISLSRSIVFLKRSQPFAGAGEGGEDKELDAVLEEQHNTSFKAEYGTLPFWRLIILQDPEVEQEFTASFIYHHAIGDGVSGLVFHSAFRHALEVACSSASLPSESDNVAPDDSLLLLLPVEELHPLPINPSPPSAAAGSLKEWTGSAIFTPCKSRWTSLCLSPAVSGAFFQECKAKGVSVTSALPSVIATILFGILPPTEEALTCIVPVSLRPWLKLPRDTANGAIGTYFDATKVRFTRPDQEAGVWAGAEQASRAINDYLQNVSPSGEPYASIAIFKTIPDVSPIFKSLVGNPRDAAFEVTNVGLFPPSAKTEEPPLWEVGKVMLSRSSVASGAAVTISVATGGNGSMAIGLSWQEGVIEDGAVDSIKQKLGEYFQKYQ